MDKSFAAMLFQLIIVLPCIIGIIYLSLRFGGNKLQNLQNGRFIKIMERVSLSKENSLVVARIGEKGFVLTSTNGKIEILLELKEEELAKLQEVKPVPQYANLKEIYEKFNTRRKGEHEKES